nr:MAG TPA: hypothetical protein [Caudoviricetes sp.]
MVKGAVDTRLLGGLIWLIGRLSLPLRGKST